LTGKNQCQVVIDKNGDKPMKRRDFIVSGSLLAAAGLSSAAFAKGDLPSGPVTMFVGFPAGGGTDVLARLIGQQFSSMWNIPVVVENRSGAAGVIAARHVAKQANDGNSLLV